MFVRKRKCFFLFMFLLLPHVWPSIAPAQQATQSISDLYSLTIEKYHNEEFEEAIRLARQIRSERPEDPAGAFALLATYQTIMRNYRIRTYESTYDSLLNLSIELTKKALKRDKRNAQNYFYLGCALGSRCIFFTQRNHWLAALRDGSQVTKNFERALAYDPEFYDAYYGIGLLQYWMAAKSKLLRVLPFASDNRHKGIENIQLAVEKGRLMNVDGMYGLSDIFLNEGEYDKALQITETLRKRYPRNPTLHYRRGIIFEKLEEWEKAHQSYDQLAGLLKQSPYRNNSYLMECYYRLAQTSYQLERYLESKQYCDWALDLWGRCNPEVETDGPYIKSEEVVKALKKLHADLQTISLAHSAGS